MIGPRKVVKRELIFDGDRWAVPGTHDSYLLRVWFSPSVRENCAALFFRHGRYGRDQLIIRHYANKVGCELKYRIRSKRLSLIRRPLHERKTGCPMALVWHEDEV